MDDLNRQQFGLKFAASMGRLSLPLGLGDERGLRKIVLKKALDS